MMSDEAGSKRKIQSFKTVSEPSRGSRTGRKNTITLRVGDDLHEALYDAADQELVSVAAEAERRLRRSFVQDRAPGDSKLAALLHFMAAASNLLIEHHGGSLEAGGDILRRELREVWMLAIQRFMPKSKKVRDYHDRVRRLYKLRRELEPAVRAIRLERGLSPLPAEVRPVGNGGPLFLEDEAGPVVIGDRVKDGAVDAARDEYRNLPHEPSEAELNWAQAVDELRVLQAGYETDRDDARVGALVVLIQSMLDDLEPKEREMVTEHLKNSN